MFMEEDNYIMQTSETSAEAVFLKGGIKAGIVTPKLPT